jgi:hypothetical protein
MMQHMITTVVPNALISYDIEVRHVTCPQTPDISWLSLQSSLLPCPPDHTG